MAHISVCNPGSSFVRSDANEHNQLEYIRWQSGNPISLADFDIDMLIILKKIIISIIST